MSTLEIQNLFKTYRDGTLALQDLSFSIEKNHIIGLVGPNGSGKTTIMRILCGLLTLSRGSVMVEDLDLNKNLSKVQAMIGYLPQQDALFPDLTVYENLYYFGIIFGIFNKNLLNQRIKALSKRFHLKGVLRTRVEKLSGGFRRRVGIATTLLHDPKILIFDEPTLGLDPLIRIEFWKLFRDLKAKGKTILISTHYMEEADNCSKVAVLTKGRLAAFDKPDELRRRVFNEIYVEGHNKTKIRFEDVYLDLIR